MSESRPRKLKAQVPTGLGRAGNRAWHTREPTPSHCVNGFQQAAINPEVITVRENGKAQSPGPTATKGY